MKKIDITNNKNPNFIGAYNIENDSLCEKIVSFFEENKDLQSQGAVGDGVDEKIKKSTDITIYPNNLKEEKFFLFKDYLNSLNKCYQDYRETYPFLKKFITKVDLGYFNIQKYLPGGHFAELHSERTSLQNLHRLFAWMTYLNDVDDGGTTDFDYFDKLSVDHPEISQNFLKRIAQILAYRLRRIEQFDAIEQGREDMRKELAADLHDQTMSELSAILMNLGLMKYTLSSDSALLDQVDENPEISNDAPELFQLGNTIIHFVEQISGAYYRENILIKTLKKIAILVVYRKNKKN